MYIHLERISLAPVALEIGGDHGTPWRLPWLFIECGDTNNLQGKFEPLVIYCFVDLSDFRELSAVAVAAAGNRQFIQFTVPESTWLL